MTTRMRILTDLTNMKPCPFCGAGETRVDESTMWTGMRSIVVSVTIKHWCAPDLTSGESWSSYHEFRGKTAEQAAARWNARVL